MEKNGKDGVIKPYWFIIMGQSSQCNEPVYYYLYRTTAKLDYYGTSGDRKNEPHKRLNVSTYTFFERDCVIDFSFPPEKATLDSLHHKISDNTIEIMGDISLLVRELYGLMIKGKGTPAKIMADIQIALTNEGFNNLKETPRKNAEKFRKKYS